MPDHHLSTDPFAASIPLELLDGEREPRRIGILGGMGPLATADLYWPSTRRRCRCP